MKGVIKMMKVAVVLIYGLENAIIRIVEMENEAYENLVRNYPKNYKGFCDVTEIDPLLCEEMDENNNNGINTYYSISMC